MPDFLLHRDTKPPVSSCCGPLNLKRILAAAANTPPMEETLAAILELSGDGPECFQELVAGIMLGLWLELNGPANPHGPQPEDFNTLVEWVKTTGPECIFDHPTKQ